VPTTGADVSLEASGEGEGEPVGGLIASAELRREIAGEGETVEEALDERVEARGSAVAAVEEAQGELVDLSLSLELERAHRSTAADRLGEVEEVAQPLDRGEGVGEALIGEHLARRHRLQADEERPVEGEGDVDALLRLADDHQLVAAALEGGVGVDVGDRIEPCVGAVERLQPAIERAEGRPRR
jgi:hypothetical protein